MPTTKTLQLGNASADAKVAATSSSVTSSATSVHKRGKRTKQRLQTAVFKPEWSQPDDNGYCTASNGPLPETMTPDGTVLIAYTQRSKIKSVNAIRLYRAFLDHPGWLAHHQEQAKMSEVSSRGRAVGPTPRDKRASSTSKSADYLYVDDDGDSCGPYTRAEFQTLIDNGYVTADTQVATRGMAGFTAAKKCPPVAELLANRLPTLPPK